MLFIYCWLFDLVYKSRFCLLQEFSLVLFLIWQNSWQIFLFWFPWFLTVCASVCLCIRKQERPLQVRMEVHHQPAFLSGGGSAENPGENLIQVTVRWSKEHFLKIVHPTKIRDMNLLVLKHDLILKKFSLLFSWPNV